MFAHSAAHRTILSVSSSPAKGLGSSANDPQTFKRKEREEKEEEEEEEEEESVMGDNLFEGLPPPSHQQEQQGNDDRETSTASAGAAETTMGREKKREPSPIPVLKSALKRPKPASEESKPEPKDAAPEKAPAPKKQLRFKMTTDASKKQVIEAMQKIASHIKTPTKMAKASKLAIQLIQYGSVRPGTSDHFFAILEAAMSSTTSCTDPSVRADYHALFSAAQDVAECLNKKQKNQLTAWTTMAVVANDLFTDDSFVFSKTASHIKEAITSLPVATEDDDMEEAASLKDDVGATDEESKTQGISSGAPVEGVKNDESDPFGLDAFIPSTMKKDGRPKGKKDTVAKTRKDDDEETTRFLKSQREALINCLEIAARRYKTPWCQTVIDILVKHAFDNVSRFTSRQRDAIDKLWASIREQQTRRKQGKSVNGKLDVTAFECLQEKYANEKMSIRHSVGASGERRATQWLG